MNGDGRSTPEQYQNDKARLVLLTVSPFWCHTVVSRTFLLFGDITQLFFVCERCQHRRGQTAKEELFYPLSQLLCSVKAPWSSRNSNFRHFSYQTFWKSAFDETSAELKRSHRFFLYERQVFASSPKWRLRSRRPLFPALAKINYGSFKFLLGKSLEHENHHQEGRIIAPWDINHAPNYIKMSTL